MRRQSGFIGEQLPIRLFCAVSAAYVTLVVGHAWSQSETPPAVPPAAPAPISAPTGLPTGGSESAAVPPSSDGFSDRGWVLRDACWLHRLFDDHLRVLFGRGDPSDFAGGTRMQNINNSFSNRAFSANPSVAYPAGHGPTAGISVIPSNFFYMTAGASNACSRSNTFEIDSLFNEWDMFDFGEFGFTPKIEGGGAGRDRVVVWHMDEREGLATPIVSNGGVSIIANQDIDDSLLVFARYGSADNGVANVTNMGQVGIGIRGLFGSPDDLFGFGASLTEPSFQGEKRRSSRSPNVGKSRGTCNSAQVRSSSSIPAEILTQT